MTPTFDQLYAALEKRSPEFDGLFFTAVKTTRIFCRPTCPARTPFAKNVEFFASAKECLEAGYRACKRCKPLDMHEPAPEWMAKLIAQMESAPEIRITDREIRQMDLDPATVRRQFVKRHGMSFHAFQRAFRMGQALGELRRGGDQVDAAMAAGYRSESGFREAFHRILGQEEIPGEPVWAKWIETPLGSMLALAGDEGLGLLEFIDRPMLETQLKTFRRRWKRPILPGSHPILDRTEAELAEYFEGKRREFSVKLHAPGTDFQERVWQELLTVPYGQTRSYAEQAARIGHPTATRAVAKSNGDNRISIIIPCHRVIGADGRLTGYGGGLWRKQKLLDLERN